MTNCLSSSHECCFDTLYSISLILGCLAVGESWCCLSMFHFSSNISLLASSSAGNIDLLMSLSGIACFGTSLSLSLMNF